MSDRLSWIEHKGTRILYVDYTGTSEEEFIQTIDEFKNELLKQTPGSVGTLSNMTNTVVTPNVTRKFKELAEQTRGISIGAAAIGVTGFKMPIAEMVRKGIYYADSLKEAKDWLAEQARK